MLTPNVKTDVIDADAHVVENERVWDYLDADDEKYRPTLVAEPDNPERPHWVLDGEDLGPKFPSPNEKQSEEHVKRFGREVGTPVQARELSDVTQRLRHMDALGIDVQVLYNSLWLRPLTRCHGDTSSELNAISRFKAMEGLYQPVKRKILSDNPRRFYGI